MSFLHSRPRFKTGLEDKIIAEVLRQIPAGFHREISDDKNAGEQPLSPEESLSRLKTHDELVVELVAAEPLLEDPVAIDFGWDGRVWVAEIPDYTRPLDAKPDKGGSIKVLSDTNADGQFDDAVVFQDGLRFPFDVKVWREGVIVCDAPDVIYLEDTDGDQKADVRKTLLTGFGNTNAQARVNSLRWGIDGWVYGSCGIFGGRIKSFNGQELELGDRDFRFHPDTGVIEPVTGRTQQSRVCDDAGNWFGCNSGTMVAHYPLSDNYLARNPFVVSPPVQCYFFAESEELFPVGNPTILKLSGPPGRPTSACGLEIYRDDLLGEQYAGNSFTAEPVNLLVHRRVLSANGVTFNGRRAANESDREFLTSTDPWFRPVQIRTGLDGCLWVVDMHREVIEHPTWISPEAMQTLNPSAGNAEGRLYRIRPKDRQPRPVVDLRSLDAADLVAALDSPNGPQRDLAQQLIVQRELRDAAPLLEKLLVESQRGEARLHALNALAALDALTEEVLLRALGDPSGAVRRHAVRLGEEFLVKSPSVVDAMLAKLRDDDPQVKLQLAYSLGECDDPRAAQALAEIAWSSQNDPYMSSAVWSSLNRQNVLDVFSSLLAKTQSHEPASAMIDAISTYAAKLGETSFLPEAVRLLGGGDGEPWAAWRVSGVASLLAALDLEVRDQVLGDQAVGAIIRSWAPIAQEALGDPDSQQDRVVAAMRFLGVALADDEAVVAQVATLLEPRHSPELQHAALNFLAASRRPSAAEGLLGAWIGYSPSMRSSVLDVVLARGDLLPLLLERLESGGVKAVDVDATHRLQLLRHDDAAIRDRAAAAFGSAINVDRQRVVDEYQSAKELAGDTTHGGEVFRKHCANCHKLGDVGNPVGPDLAALTNRTPAAMIESIFDPNRAVEEKYQGYTAVTDDGLAYTGILASESATSITLVEQQGKQSSLLRESLQSLQSTGQSLMPEGIEKDLTPQDVADLLAHLAVHAPRPESPEGETPAVAPAVADAPPDASTEIAKLLEGVEPGTAAESQQIPKIWEHALAAGTRNDENELTRLLQIALPKSDEPLRNWQAVVIGGGIVNGLSGRGVWPHERMLELVGREESLADRWGRTLDLAVEMAGDSSIHLGTRYDALRILGADFYERAGHRLKQYLKSDVEHDLQMGAVSALGDIQCAESTRDILEHFAEYEAGNRDLAVAALLRTDDRKAALLDALESGDIPVSALAPAQAAALQESETSELRRRSRLIFSDGVQALDAPSK